MIPLVSLKKKQIVCSVFWDFLFFFFLLKKEKGKKSSLEKIPEHSLPIENYISGLRCSVTLYGNSFLIYKSALLSPIFEKTIPEHIFLGGGLQIGKRNLIL